MGELGRIYRDLWRHPKRDGLSWEALGVWAHFISWTKDNRTKGFVPHNELKGLEIQAKELAQHVMWDEVDGGYQYHDYLDRNPEDLKLSDKASARYLVDTKLPDHPDAVRTQLTGEVIKLIQDGTQTIHILAALDKWQKKDSAPPSWLPLFVSDAIRSPEHHLDALLYEVRESGEISRLKEFGFTFPAPDVPPELQGQNRRDYVTKAKRDWVDGLIRQRKLW